MPVSDSSLPRKQRFRTRRVHENSNGTIRVENVASLRFHEFWSLLPSLSLRVLFAECLSQLGASNGRNWGHAAEAGCVEPFGYLSEDAEVWAIMTAPPLPSGVAAQPVRFGTEIALHGPAVEPVGGRGEACWRALRGYGIRRPGAGVNVDAGRVSSFAGRSWATVGRVRWSPGAGQIVLRNPVCNEGKDGGSAVSGCRISLFILIGYRNQPTHAALIPGGTSGEGCASRWRSVAADAERRNNDGQDEDRRSNAAAL